MRRTLHVLAGSLEVEMDDDAVRAMREGQDAEFEVKEESDASIDEVEIRLFF